MGSLDRAKDALEKLQQQGCEVDATVSQAIETYEQQADKADKLLLEKQAKERESQ
jgi:hypothetical protein